MKVLGAALAALAVLIAPLAAAEAPERTITAPEGSIVIVVPSPVPELGLAADPADNATCGFVVAVNTLTCRWARAFSEGCSADQRLRTTAVAKAGLLLPDTVVAGCTAAPPPPRPPDLGA